MNVGSSSHSTIIEFLDLLFELLEWRPQMIQPEHWRAVGVASRASDNTLIRSIFDWEPSMGLEEGLGKDAVLVPDETRPALDRREPRAAPPRPLGNGREPGPD